MGVTEKLMLQCGPWAVLDALLSMSERASRCVSDLLL